MIRHVRRVALVLLLLPGCASEIPEDRLRLIFGDVSPSPVVLAHESHETTECWLVTTEKLPSPSGEVEISPIPRDALIGIAAALGVDLKSTFELRGQGHYHEWATPQGQIRMQFVPIDGGYVAYVEYLNDVD